MAVLELYSLDTGTGVALVTAQALRAGPLVRITHAAAAPVQVAREIVCALHVYIDFLCRPGGEGGREEREEMGGDTHTSVRVPTELTG